jgi:hypothetical protein
MDESYPHLPLEREVPVTEKRTRPGPRPVAPDDPAAHARGLKARVQDALQQTDGDLGGFDERRLFRFEVAKGFNPDDLRHLSADIELVSQEADTVVVAFVSKAALESFEARLALMAQGDAVSYKQVIYALQGIDGWSAEDRTGWALRKEGMPAGEPFLLDLELWPVDARPAERDALWDAFRAWLAENGIEALDGVRQPGLLLQRVRCTRAQAERLLRHRDVRTVDLPPRYGLDLRVLTTDIQNIPRVPSPKEGAPGIVVLDSGLATGHPLLAPAVGDAESFLPGHGPDDEHGHGTHVAGLALYGDVQEALESGAFVPELRLFSGRILDRNNENETGFVENQVAEAVRYFHGQYGCRVFNLSFGDRNKPYLGGHVRGLALTLDTLSRDLGVLFVVSAGNVSGDQLTGLAWKDDYPGYLSSEDWTLIDPATALNALTVGSIARFDRSHASGRHPTDPSEVPLARRGQPSPFTRHGPSVGGAVKPEVVAYGGNWALNTRGGANYLVTQGLGEVSTNVGFAGGNLLAADAGTSFAAPQVAQLAARMLVERPDAPPELLRALLLAHANVPESTRDLIPRPDMCRSVAGYGQIDSLALFRSLEKDVSLVAIENITNKRHHFYEILVPKDFLSSGRRDREISIALAYTPAVRSTRVAYKATRMDFKLVAGPDIEHVSRMFSRATDKDDHENIPELKTPDCSAQVRGKGTVQKATWRFRQINGRSILKTKRLFVVVTRNDNPWGEVLSHTEEPYVLVVCLRDRANERARLYTQIRGQLRVRQAGRAKVRV